jgi:hypothetical protein
VLDMVAGQWRAPLVLAGVPTGSSNVAAIACPSASLCVAGGVTPQSSTFVDDEVDGRWSSAQVLAGVAGKGGVEGVSCGSSRSCAALAGDGVASYGDGAWGAVQPVPGLSRVLGAHGRGGFAAIACGSAGGCAIGGAYAAPPPPNSDFDTQALVDAYLP